MVANIQFARGVTGTLAPSRRIKRPTMSRRRFEQGPEAEVRVLSADLSKRAIKKREMRNCSPLSEGSQSILWIVSQKELFITS